MELASILLFIGGLGGPEVILIILVFVLFFGAKRIPEMAKGLGRGIREFKESSREIKDNFEKSAAVQPETEQVNLNRE
ncbi:twin-arginine translocase TatA/TatE family subunit [Pontibacter sp. BT731]|uniref:twin-arginine translocase TatA/TatE family subunit n=1 Tax=Pontibacter coccineus TaxID=3063328 RepID=UPI0026E34D03|nr:twin-arginine translocase TatA/TatE family subunit [Pontibacter sp. BT731]MDO6391860.1 twin-arginine translocase TatA/TatE family subunit [Pontibacter sp. BT731]